jgi:hypothetical protein
MRRTIPVYAVHLRDRLFRQLSLLMQRWVTQQADQIVRSRRFGLGEETRLDQAIQSKVHVFPRLGGTNVALVRSILKFLVLMDAGAALFSLLEMEAMKNKRQETMTSFENFDQKVTQLFNLISTVLKDQKETENDITRNLLC